MKLPDFLDLFVAMTGRAPVAGSIPMKGAGQRGSLCSLPRQVHDDNTMAMVGWLVGSLCPTGFLCAWA